MKGITTMKTKQAHKIAMSKYYYTEKGKQAYFRAQLKRRAKVESNPELKRRMLEYVTAHRIAYMKTDRGKEVHRNAMRKYSSKPEVRERIKMLRQLRIEKQQATIH
jgi:hypothetical protein